MEFSLTQMWEHMGLPARLVAGVLVVMGLASLTVFIERLLSLGRSRKESLRFAEQVKGHLRADQIGATLADAAQHPNGHLPQIVGYGLSAYEHARETRDVSGLPPAERTRRQVERYLDDVGNDLRRGLWVLASVGSVAPFVGLLGTVVGIISAFQGIASSGSGGLSSVSAGISEALVETALGLTVAIPAVLAFNYLATVIGLGEKSLHKAAGELLDAIEQLPADLLADPVGIGDVQDRIPGAAELNALMAARQKAAAPITA